MQVIAEQFQDAAGKYLSSQSKWNLIHGLEYTDNWAIMMQFLM